ncbi:signal recognition particle-docking protein FtsY [Anaerococcus urinomassiliensis]|uniref:signal recognition particle-docking protein FtsY n=1 Tax=Anaerococcus urinomassiliensis TaxID=1745712 RepID=UPI00093FC537|nr:signal recognition particle-docking protein FtsY [Anaerococcus urinomassiliensis]
MFDFFRRKKDKEKTEEIKKESENLAFEDEIEENVLDDDSKIEDKQNNIGDKDRLVFESGSISNEVEKTIDNEDTSKSIDEDSIREYDSKNHIENKFVKMDEEDLSNDEGTYASSEDEFNETDQNLENSDDEVKKVGFFDRIRNGLVKTRDQFSSQVKNLFTANVKIDDELFEELEEILISADIGMDTTLAIVDSLRYEIKERKIKDSDQIYPLLEEIMVRHLDRDNLNNDLNINDNDLAIILVIGVNGVGKTTTIGKLAYNLKNEGKTVMLAAADTFRAAAIEQLGEWADRADVEMIAHKEGSDPSAVIFDAIQSAKNKNVDVLICDTAGRLHNKKNLMKELEKINKTIDSHAGKATRDNILVLDATTGQNAVSQLREFKNVTDITGLILTKLDGTAKGGIIFPLQYELNVPVKYIGLGEGIDNLEKFDSKTFVDALF